jgi:hypothetical protein
LRSVPWAKPNWRAMSGKGRRSTKKARKAS